MNKISEKVNKLVDEMYSNITESEKFKLITFSEKYKALFENNIIKNKVTNLEKKINKIKNDIIKLRKSL